MKINVELELTEEEMGAMKDHAAEEGAESVEAYLAGFCMEQVQRLTARAFDLSAEKLVNAAKALTFEKRKEIIAMVAGEVEI